MNRKQEISVLLLFHAVGVMAFSIVLFLCLSGCAEAPVNNQFPESWIYNQHHKSAPPHQYEWSDEMPIPPDEIDRSPAPGILPQICIDVERPCLLPEPDYNREPNSVKNKKITSQKQKVITY
jgi:hypothetical protein